MNQIYLELLHLEELCESVLMAMRNIKTDYDYPFNRSAPINCTLVFRLLSASDYPEVPTKVANVWRGELSYTCLMPINYFVENLCNGFVLLIWF